MLAGILIGRVISKRKSYSIFSRMIFPIVIILLFFMGIAIGLNEEILLNFKTLGSEAFILTAGSVIGATAGGFILMKLLVKYKKVKA